MCEVILVTSRDVFRIPRKLVRKYHTRDPFVLAERLGVIVKFCADFVKQRGASAIILGDRVIFINSNLSEQMQRMVCAHELGHLLLHKATYGKEAWVLNHELFDITNDLEYEANVFAANLLIEDEVMFDYFEDGHSIVATASGLDVNVNLLVLKVVEMNKQQGFNFQVSDVPDRAFMGSIPDSQSYDW